ncbi:MAG: DUF4349 domain-containing protein [Gemmatimonadaceae bacterium]
MTTVSLVLAMLAIACDRAPDAPEPTRAEAMMGASAASTGASHAVMSQRGGAIGGPESDRLLMAPAMATNASSVKGNDGGAISFGAPMPLTDPSGAMLIRNGQASVEVKRMDDAVTKLRQAVAQLGGFVANTSIVGGKEEHRSASIEIRIPSAQFDAAVIALATLGTVESVSATVQDAGDEYVDLGARVANARHMEARLLEMLARRTGKLSEALTVEQELRRVREEIERFDARLKWIERRAAISSLQITLHEPSSVLDRRGPSPIAEAFAEAWRRAVGVVAWCIASLGVVVPFGLMLMAILLLARRLFRPGAPSGVSGA